MKQKLIFLFMTVLLWSLGTFTGFAKPNTEPVVSLEAQNRPLAEIFPKLAQNSKETLLTFNTPGGQYSVSFQSIPLSSALTAICQQSNLKWRRLWVKPNSRGLINVEELVQSVQVLDDAEMKNLIVFNPETKLTYATMGEVSDKGSDLLSKTEQMKRVYLIYREKTTGKPSSRGVSVKEYAPLAANSLNSSNPNAVSVRLPFPVGSGSNLTGGTSADSTGVLSQYAKSQAASLSTLQNMTADQRKTARKDELQMYNQLDSETQRYLANTGLMLYKQYHKNQKKK